MNRLLNELSSALRDFAWALWQGSKDGLRLRVLPRSALISIVATGLTLWLFFWHWPAASHLLAVFVPKYLVRLLGGAGKRPPWPATGASAYDGGPLVFDMVGSARSMAASVEHLASSLHGAAHVLLAMAVAVVCSFIACWMFLLFCGIRFSLLPRAGMAEADFPVPSHGHARHGSWLSSAWRRIRLPLIFYVLCQLVFVLACQIPHASALWLLLIAYFFARTVIETILSPITTRAEIDAVVRQLRLSALLLGSLTMILMLIPVVNLWVPGMFCCAMARLSLRAWHGRNSAKPRPAVQAVASDAQPPR
jgi:hypothetical protein